ncbi:hypothetical protein Ami103574_15210 [Aminipila butyrica]|uniref:Uncharacterized protein n=1 Tax=Aminipila butyrica TaxID=433296 RepID=A0A858BZI5_9FIRM|nr:hypothetical protein [Aminipila butyrica]QIB70558.1 hypothetical protein Ami103574_15210 [Aminipila butyrica]
MIKTLSESSFDRIAKSYFNVFSGNNPFEDCFKKEIEKVELLYPVDGYYMTRKQYTALKIALSNLYIDEEVYISEIEKEAIGDIFKQNCDVSKYELKHWSFDLSTSYDEYMQIDVNVENAIYSSQGRWGIIISHEEHAVIGGSIEFLDEFKAKYPEFNSSLNNFQAHWEYNKNNYNSDMEWYNRFIQSLKR